MNTSLWRSMVGLDPPHHSPGTKVLFQMIIGGAMTLLRTKIGAFGTSWSLAMSWKKYEP